VEPLYDRVLAFIGDAAADRFDDLAVAVFAHQFDNCTAYRRYCLDRGRTPESVCDWRSIPAVPIAAFKQAELCCGPAERTFLSSGTTAGVERRSRHSLPDLRLYRAAALAGVRRFLLPDAARMRMLSLIPPVVDAPHSSLAQMVDWAIAHCGEPDSAYAAGAGGIDHARFIECLRAAERDGRPLCVLTTTGALIRVLDHLRAERLEFRLPHGSRLMDTGGDKGAPRHLSPRGVLHAVWSAFAIPGYFCLNEYGMAELSSQYYDSVIADREAGRHRTRRKLAPHWLRTLVLDPEGLEPVRPGGRGLLCHFDLANAGSAMVVLSEDVGELTDDGFHLIGRAPGAEPRGCSLTAVQWDERAAP
jgi:Acyl-protein synthetase, LuxE